MRNVELAAVSHSSSVLEGASVTFFALLVCKKWAYWHSVIDLLCLIEAKLHKKTMEAEATQVTYFCRYPSCGECNKGLPPTSCRHPNAAGDDFCGS